MRAASSRSPTASRGEQKTFREEAIELRRRHGGVLEIHSKLPIRDQHILNMVYVPPAALVPAYVIRRRPVAGHGADLEGQPGRDRHRRLRRARPRRYRPAGRAAGHGGQGGHLPLDGRRRSLSDLPGRARSRRDRRDRRRDLAQLRRHQPGGHLGPALLRDRARSCASGSICRSSTTTSTARRSSSRPPCSTPASCAARRSRRVRITINGGGAAGIAVTKLLLSLGAGDVVICDRAGAVYEGRKTHMDFSKREIAAMTNREKRTGQLARRHRRLGHLHRPLGRRRADAGDDQVDGAEPDRARPGQSGAGDLARPGPDRRRADRRHRPLRLSRTRSTTRWPSPASSAARSMSGPGKSTTR